MKIKLLAFLIALLFASGTSFAATLTLNWTDNSTNEDGFKVERKTGQAGTFAEVGQTAADVTTFADTIADAETYCYRVSAFNAAGNSPPSNEACATTLTTPAVPGTVTIVITITP